MNLVEPKPLLGLSESQKNPNIDPKYHLEIIETMGCTSKGPTFDPKYHLEIIETMGCTSKGITFTWNML
jgi:hypothetical protein